MLSVNPIIRGVISKQACALALLACLAWTSHGQEFSRDLDTFPVPAKIITDLPPIPAPEQPFDGALLQVSGCASCGSGLVGSGLGRMSGGGSPSSRYDSVGGGGPDCSLGRKNCACCEHDSFTARLLCGLYECLACPDPCFEPSWEPITDVGFFTECARPVSQQRLRMTSYQHMTNYTRNSYKIAPPGLGPIMTTARAPYYLVDPSVSINEASLYTEIAAGNVGVTIDVPFLMTNFEHGLIKGGGGSGFGNMTVGTKSSLYDSELMQVGWSLKTNLPVGLPLVGLGNGLVSMEVGALIGLRISDTCYLQANFTEWIPFGGLMPFFPGAMFINRLSLNKKVWQANANVPVFMNVEYSGYFFQAGGYTPYELLTSVPSPSIPVTSPGYSYHQLGPGVRVYMTDKIDTGFAVQFSLNPDQGSWGDQQYRLDFRFRY